MKRAPGVPGRGSSRMPRVGAVRDARVYGRPRDAAPRISPASNPHAGPRIRDAPLRRWHALG
jgi:hypothetical protein